MKIVTFCGHRDSIITPDIESWLNKSIEYFIQNGAKTFYLGGYGAFDVKVVSVIHKMKAFYPWIESVLVIPYLDFKPDCLQTALYDSFVYPPLETVPRRVAILRRNQWMAEQCDVLIAYIQRETGGAYQTLQWAKKIYSSISTDCLVVQLPFSLQKTAPPVFGGAVCSAIF